MGFWFLSKMYAFILIHSNENRFRQMFAIDTRIYWNNIVPIKNELYSVRKNGIVSIEHASSLQTPYNEHETDLKRWIHIIYLFLCYGFIIFVFFLSLFIVTDRRLNYLYQNTKSTIRLLVWIRYAVLWHHTWRQQMQFF